MRRVTGLLLTCALFALFAPPATGYVLLDPPRRIGDPDLPYVYHIYYELDEPSIEGDHEFQLVRRGFESWQDQVPNIEFAALEGEPAHQCGVVPNARDQISFQDCQGLCGSGVLAVHYPLAYAQGDGFWTTGTDTPFVAILETDIVFCKNVEFDDPPVDWPPCDGAVDLQGLVTRMAGRNLGLDCSEIPEASMSCSFAPCDSTKRSLHADDKLGFQRLYGQRVNPRGCRP